MAVQLGTASGSTGAAGQPTSSRSATPNTASHASSTSRPREPPTSARLLDARTWSRAAEYRISLPPKVCSVARALVGHGLVLGRGGPAGWRIEHSHDNALITGLKHARAGVL